MRYDGNEASYVVISNVDKLYSESCSRLEACEDLREHYSSKYFL